LVAFRFDGEAAQRKGRWQAEQQLHSPLLAARALQRVPGALVAPEGPAAWIGDPGTYDEAAVLRAAQSMFRPEESIAAVVSRWDPEAILSVLEPAFAAWAPRDRSPPLPRAAPSGPRRVFVPLDTLTSTVSLACPLAGRAGGRAVATDLVSSRLQSEIREQRAWSYAPVARTSNGVLSLSIQTEPARAADVLGLATAALRGPAEEEVLAARSSAMLDFPLRWPAEDLAFALASGGMELAELETWDADVRVESAASVAANLAACGDSAVWLITGPDHSSVPTDTPRQSFAELKSALSASPAR
jgi:hypothetical protein